MADKKCGECGTSFPKRLQTESKQEFLFCSDVCRKDFLEGKTPAKRPPRGYRKFIYTCHQCRTPMALNQYNQDFCSLKCHHAVRDRVLAIMKEEEEERRKTPNSFPSFSSGYGGCH